jgi:hypothetical protein
MSDHPGTADTPCGEQLDPAVEAAAALAEELRLIRQMAAESLRWDKENLAAIPTGYDGVGFTVQRYWSDRVKLSASWAAFCADPVNHPGRKNLAIDGAERVHE